MSSNLNNTNVNANVNPMEGGITNAPTLSNQNEEVTSIVGGSNNNTNTTIQEPTPIPTLTTTEQQNTNARFLFNNNNNKKTDSTLTEKLPTENYHTPATHTDIINFKAGSLMDWKTAAKQRVDQRKEESANKSKLMAESGTSLFVRILDGQEMIADFKDSKFEQTSVKFTKDGPTTPRFNYTIKLLQDPATGQKVPLPGRQVVFSCSKTVSAQIDEWLSDEYDDYSIIRISRTGSDKNNTEYKVRGIQREKYLQMHNQGGSSTSSFSNLGGGDLGREEDRG